MLMAISVCPAVIGDQITLKNGDHLSGTISKADGKVLTMKSEFAGWLAWQLTLSDRYLSNPVPGTKKNDVLLTTGLRLTLAR